MNNIDIPEDWKAIAGRTKQDAKICIVIGRIDSGKATLYNFLIHKWTAFGICVGYVDSDLGQSTLGPPATVGLKIFNTPPNQADYSNAFNLHFVGNTSPEGFLLQTLHAMKIMVDKSLQQGSEITLVDITGFVGGPVARIPKLHKIELLRPQWIIVLQAKDELEYLLKGYEKMDWQVIRLGCSKRAVIRSQTERQKYRIEKYKAYFKLARLIDCSINKIVFPSCVMGTGQRINPAKLPKEICIRGVDYLYMEKCGSDLLVIANRPDTSMPLNELKGYFGVVSIVFIERFELKDLLVGLNDKDNNTLGLGTITDLDPLADKLTLFTPVTGIHKVATIRLGSLRIERGGKESRGIRAIHYL